MTVPTETYAVISGGGIIGGPNVYHLGKLGWEVVLL